jgi:hypothetical protein
MWQNLRQQIQLKFMSRLFIERLIVERVSVLDVKLIFQLQQGQNAAIIGRGSLILSGNF